MKKRTIILLSIFLVIIISAGTVAYKYRSYIYLFYKAATTSTEKLQEEKLESDQRAIEAIKEYGVETARPLTEEESEMLNSGEITEEEAVNIILGQNNSEKTEDEGISSSENESANGEDKVDSDLQKKKAEIAQLIGKVYVLKAKFTNELDLVEKWVISEYNNLTDEERKSTSVKVRIGREAYSKALALQADCDGQMEEIFSRLTILLEETGQGTALVDEIRTAYENEKAVKISYYMDKI